MFTAHNIKELSWHLHKKNLTEIVVYNSKKNLTYNSIYKSQCHERNFTIHPVKSIKYISLYSAYKTLQNYFLLQNEHHCIITYYLSAFGHYN